ncbi:tRNA 4-thiouridine(8) synthase ThiI [Clostridium sp.]|jgi:tRNA-uridine 2-sulfurtransferase|uniref:tRNA 4-thiouridine(8) synthase ThiI n=1 Tax=Clostridium sp. TaxID=1506 RepID=UPI0039F5DCFD
MTRALALISGGLDSILAAKLIKEQGIDVIGITFKSYFFGPDNAIRMTNQIGIPLEIVDFSDEHFSMTKNPKHGHGKNMNPCIDCHAMMMRYAGELLDKFEADFIITGEVLNQRPMSQNKSSLNIVKKESGFPDKILRPLSAKALPPTEMELNGLVDREKLLGITGRSRKIQMELAEKWGIKDYPSPAGGCKLTDPNFSVRLRELLQHKENPTQREIELLKIGRHFRVSQNAKIISTRTAEEANFLKKYLIEEDLGFLVKDFKGSMVVIIGDASKEDIHFAAKVAGRYSKGREEETLSVIYGKYGSPYNKSVKVEPAAEEELSRYLIV